MQHDGLVEALRKLGVSADKSDFSEPASKNDVQAWCEANGLRFYRTGETFRIKRGTPCVVMYPNPDEPNVDTVSYSLIQNVDTERVSGLIVNPVTA